MKFTFISDESDEVEKYCHKVIKHIEEVLGEPLQRYFWAIYSRSNNHKFF